MDYLDWAKVWVLQALVGLGPPPYDPAAGCQTFGLSELVVPGCAQQVESVRVGER
jgi:hypothetical protein